MILERILKPENVLCDVSARGKKHCLEMLSELLANSTPGLPHEDIFAKLAERERLGSTVLGGGVALPHCRFAGIEETNGALLRLAEAVDFESADGEPVDLIFGMMVPEEITDNHRKQIEKVSEILKDPEVRAQLRSARTPRALYSRFVHAHKSADDIPGRRKQSLGPRG